MSKDFFRKCLIFVIIVLFVGVCIVPSISGAKLRVNKMLPLSNSDPQVYSTTPDWISNNPHYSTGAALTDLNQDGWLDLIIADGNDMAMGRVNVYYNNGDGTLPTTASWQSNDLGYNGHLDVADVNGDGWPDVAVSYLGTSNSFGPIARVYLNNEGVLSSLPDWQSNVIGNSFGVDFGDMNNDGRPDLAVATGWSYSPQHFYHNYVYLNVDGTLESSASWVSDDTYHYLGALWVDADHDNWMDLAFISAFQETQIYRNQNGMLETTASWHTSDSSAQDGIMLTVGDVTLDGIPDLFATDNTQLGGSGLFKQYTGLENGFFETTYSWSYYGGYGSAVALADVNGDKKLDLATGSWWGHTDIFINEGSGLPTSPSWSSGGTSVVEKIVFGNVGPTLCERTRTEYFYPDGNCKLFHLPYQPIQRILSVYRDNVLLDHSEYTYSREHGWITVSNAPTQSIRVVYNYSRSIDMVISNWDSNIGNYLYYNQLLDADLDCDGSLSWTNVTPGETVVGSFEVSNIGDPGLELDWEIDSYPDWGTWTFDPQSGEDLTPEDGSITVNVEVIAPNEGYNEFLGEIKVVNQDDPDDYCVIQSSLVTTGPNLDCDGSLVWTNVKPGSTVTGKFYVKNVGESGSELDWEVESNPDWGDWTFTPQSGDDLTPEAGPFTVNVEVIAPNENNQVFTEKIKVINTFDPNDFCEIDVELTTSKNKVSINALVVRRLERFPNLFPILRLLLGLQ
ncbi:MAG: VCBS repeat-containing protein [Thermoplasmatales archaeon]|nr:VCBS repeat-containing protein [Thermoplasmatales archaeon]